VRRDMPNGLSRITLSTPLSRGCVLQYNVDALALNEPLLRVGCTGQYGQATSRHNSCLRMRDNVEHTRCARLRKSTRAYLSVLKAASSDTFGNGTVRRTVYAKTERLPPRRSNPRLTLIVIQNHVLGTWA
jgi:hypothetical protein